MERNVSEKEINLMDMFWAACLKWRQMLLWAVIFALLTGGMSYVKSARNVKTLQNEEEVDLEEMEKQLDEESARSVELYLNYKKMYETQMLYNEKDALMNLNPNGFYKSTISYYIDNHFEVEYPLMSKINDVHAMIDMYQGALHSEQFADKLCNLMDVKKKDASYYMDLIDCDNIYGENVSSLDGTGIMEIAVYGR